MRKRVLSILLCGGFLLPVAAKADSLFTFSTVGSGGGFSGSGQLTAADNGDGSFTITGITGTGVTGLINPGDFFNDNLLFPGASRLLDVNGFAFTAAAGGLTFSVDIFSTVSGYEAFTLDSDGNFDDSPVTLSVGSPAAVPEPGSLMLMGSGVLAMAARLRKRMAS